MVCSTVSFEKFRILSDREVPPQYVPASHFFMTVPSALKEQIPKESTTLSWKNFDSTLNSTLYPDGIVRDV